MVNNSFTYNKSLRSSLATNRINRGSNDRFIPNRATSSLSYASTIRDLLKTDSSSCESEDLHSGDCVPCAQSSYNDNLFAIDALLNDDQSLLPALRSVGETTKKGMFRYGETYKSTRRPENGATMANTISSLSMRNNKRHPKADKEQSQQATQTDFSPINVNRSVIWPWRSMPVPGITSVNNQEMGLVFSTLDGYLTIHDKSIASSWYVQLMGICGEMTCFSRCKATPKNECVFAVGDNTGSVSVAKYTKKDSVGAVCWNDDHQSAVTSIVFFQDKDFFSASQDAIVFYHDARSGDVKVRLEGHAGAITQMALNPNQKLLASADEGGIICIWRTGAILETYHSTGKDGTGVAFPYRVICVPGVLCGLDWSPRDPNMLACAEPHSGIVSVWDAETGNEMRWVDTNFSIVSVCWSRLSKELIIATHEDDGVGYAMMLDEKSLNLVCMIDFSEFADESVIELDLSDDGERLCGMSRQGEISIIDLFAQDEYSRKEADSLKRQHSKELISAGLVLPGYCVR